MGITLINKTSEKLSHKQIRDFVRKVLKELKREDVSLSIVFVEAEEIKHYNKSYRDTDAYTDVMAFPGEGKYLGDLLVCPEVVELNSKELGFPFEKELKFVLVHGILHLLGYTDYTTEEKEQMFRLQEEIINKVEGEDATS